MENGRHEELALQGGVYTGLWNAQQSLENYRNTGYDTPVGELGDTLSGGERQCLGLARAFLHDAPLLLLDDCNNRHSGHSHGQSQ